MLPERSQQLLTAYVDGELSARQRRHVERLLHRSAEARQLLKQLEQDARELRAVPAPALGTDLFGSVLQAIQDRRLKPGRPRPTRRPLRLPAWAGMAAAAAVLLVLGVGSYLVFHSAFRPGEGNVAHRGPSKPGEPPAGPPRPEEIPQPNPIVQGPGKEPDDLPGPDQPPGKGAVVEAPAPPEMEPEPGPPRDSAGPVLTDRGMEIFQIKTVETAPPMILGVHDLDRAASREKLLAELGKSPAFRLELPVSDATRALERLQSAWKGPQVNLVLDGLAQRWLKKPPGKTSFVLVAENLTPTELLQLLGKLAAADNLAVAKKPGDGLFDRLVATRLSRLDRRELTDLLGIDLAPVQPSKGSGPLGVDLHRPLPEQTTGQLTQAPPRPESGKPSTKGPEHPVLVVTLSPRPARNSPEIKRFLDSRKFAKPGTIQVMVVLRNVG